MVCFSFSLLSFHSFPAFPNGFLSLPFWELDSSGCIFCFLTYTTTHAHGVFLAYDDSVLYDDTE